MAIKMKEKIVYDLYRLMKEELKNGSNNLVTRPTGQAVRERINDYSFSIKKYHEMLGQDFSFTFIKPNNTIPYYFDEAEITEIFNKCNNIKHLAMLRPCSMPVCVPVRYATSMTQMSI